MANNILDKIINKKAQRLNQFKNTIALESSMEKINQNKNYVQKDYIGC